MSNAAVGSSAPTGGNKPLVSSSSSSGTSSEPYDRHALRLLFNACDPNHTGAITKANLLEGCRRLQLDDLTESDADALFAELDVDGGGRVSFEAFAERFTAWSQQALSLLREASGEQDQTESAGDALTESGDHGDGRYASAQDVQGITHIHHTLMYITRIFLALSGTLDLQCTSPELLKSFDFQR